ncbi:hypothetical protein MJG53_006807 [Ovis ammon polii x Ovis aries]|uniref:Uncharacterized protein n=2 Tax=Ovis TaxID=9935 RepID=A0AAD4UDW2_OVIAM|nr:hypothetical protein MG293_006065 [Ovis ammon polii]KAI4585273.1 hypothetical protein MJG53_006807 [Ovis ammon polii x Ovis aries]
MASLYQRFTGKINTSRSFPAPPEASRLLGGQGPEEDGAGPKPLGAQAPAAAPRERGGGGGAGGRPRFQYQARSDCDDEDKKYSGSEKLYLKIYYVGVHIKQSHSPPVTGNAICYELVLVKEKLEDCRIGRTLAVPMFISSPTFCSTDQFR